MKIKGIVERIAQRDGDYGIFVNNIWYNGRGECPFEQGKELEFEIEEVNKNGRTFFNVIGKKVYSPTIKNPTEEDRILFGQCLDLAVKKSMNNGLTCLTWQQNFDELWKDFQAKRKEILGY